MQHRIENYSDSDLTVAIASPYNSFDRQVDLEAELYRRQYKYETQVLELQPLTTYV